MKKIAFMIIFCMALGCLPASVQAGDSQAAGVLDGELKIEMLDSPLEAALAQAREDEDVSRTGEASERDSRPEEELSISEEKLKGISVPEEPNRLIVRLEGPLSSAYGAERGFYYTVGGEYVLEYGTRADAEYAKEKLAEEYGGDAVCFDGLIRLESEPVSEDGFDGIAAMGLDTLRESAKDWSGGVTVAVVDSGIDSDHPLFAGRLDTQNSVSLTGAALEDRHGHGTHVSGVIANGTPAQVKIMAVQIFDESDITTITMLEYGIDYAAQKGAGVINLSVGDSETSAEEKSLLDEALARAVRKGAVVCAASGNEYGDVADNYPGGSRWSVSVGALQKNGDDIVAADYSNRGSLLDFTAPGSDIVSAWLEGGTMEQSGTSMACPHLSAAAAMVKLKHPDYDQWDVYAAFRDNAVDLGDAGWDERYGYGYVNLSKYADAESSQTDSARLYQGIRGDAVITKQVGDEPFAPEAFVSRGDGGLTVSSADDAVAVVENGLVTIRGAGSCELIVTAGETESFRETSRKILLVVREPAQKEEEPPGEDPDSDRKEPQKDPSASENDPGAQKPDKDADGKKPEQSGKDGDGDQKEADPAQKTKQPDIDSGKSAADRDTKTAEPENDRGESRVEKKAESAAADTGDVSLWSLPLLLAAAAVLGLGALKRRNS